MYVKRLSRTVFALIALCACTAHAGNTCLTEFVDTQDGEGSLRDAIEDINASGCESGGMNQIVIDPNEVTEIVLATGLPSIERPTHLYPAFSAGSRFPIRTTSASFTSFVLHARAPVIIEDIEILGEASRRFLAGIRLETGADNSRIRGVRLDRIRSTAISVASITGLSIERSANWPVVITNSGWGQNPTNPAFAPGISISASTDVTVQGTFLGVDDAGMGAGNCTYGIDVSSSTLVTIGGVSTNVNERNVVAANRLGGIRVRNSALVSVSGNYIGVAGDGSTLLGNALSSTCFTAPPPDTYPPGGVVIVDSDFVDLGDANFTNSGNWIVGNGEGVRIDNSQNVTLLRNRIGLRPDFVGASNVGAGVRVRNGAGDAGRVLIGSEEHSRTNWILGGASATHGVVVEGDAGEVRLRTNRIYGFSSTGGLPINRSGPPAAPMVDYADPNTGTIAGTLSPAAPADGVIDIFSDLPDGDEARFYLGSVSVSAGATSFITTINPTLFTGGRQVSATYTQEGANSSGTSALGPVVLSLPRWIVTPSAGIGGAISPELPQEVNEGSTVEFIVTPDPGFAIDTVGGTCGGNLMGTEFTTSPVMSDCTVEAGFVEKPTADFAATPLMIDFGLVQQGAQSNPVTVTVTNQGSVPGWINTLQLGGSYSADFALPPMQDGCSGQTIAAGGMCQFDVIYTPSGLGPRDAWVNVESDDPDGPLTITLLGNSEVIFSDGMESP